MQRRTSNTTGDTSMVNKNTTNIIDPSCDNRLSVHLNNIKLDNPIIPASGTFGFGYEFADIFDINCLGSISIKGTTINPRFGNDTPRISETASGMLNAVGLQNPGAKHVLKEELPKLSKVYNKQIIANVSGFSVDEYVQAVEILDESPQIAIFEINISCPNVHSGGMSFGVSCEQASKVVSAIRKTTKKPIYIKLSPNVTDIVSIAKACENEGADGLSLINTLLGMRIDIQKSSPILKNITGGLSGPAIFPIALRMVWDVYKSVKIPIIGMGGISCAEDVIEMMMAGASAVQIGAQNLIDPLCCPKIIEDLPHQLDKLKVNQIEQIIGIAHEK